MPLYDAIGLCVFLVIAPTIYADCESEALGTEYLLAFLDMDSEPAPAGLLLSSPEGATVRVQAPSLANEPMDRTLTLEAGERRSEEVTGVRMEGVGKAGKVLRVSSATVFTAAGLNAADQAGCDGYLALPTDRLGKEYYTVHHYPPSVAGEFAVAAGAGGAAVAVYAPAKRTTLLDIGGPELAPARGRLVFELGAYEAMQIQSPDLLSGTRIYANKPVAVFSGNVRVTVNNAGAENVGSHVVEQLIPASQWGKEFYVVPHPHRQFTNIKVISTVEGASLTVSGIPGIGTTIYTLDHTTREQIVLIANGYYTIRSSHPVQVAQVADSKVREGSRHSLFSAMSLIPATSQYKKQYYFSLPPSVPGKEFEHYVLLVIRDSKREGLTLDDAVVDQSGWVTLPASNVSVSGKALLLADGGSHWLKHPDTPFGAVLYGSNNASCTYAFPAGFCLQKDPDAGLSVTFPEVNVTNVVKGQSTPSTITSNASGPSQVSSDPTRSTTTTTAKDGQTTKKSATTGDGAGNSISGAKLWIACLVFIVISYH